MVRYGTQGCESADEEILGGETTEGGVRDCCRATPDFTWKLIAGLPR
jgi:hypothetical protein